ncbi:MAG: thiamine phosphate synthase [Bacteroidales bacterium]|nr:thiamine phosphate synthase [Bacteroidales bacterium]
MRLIAISWPDFFEGEAEAVNALFHEGLERLHIRKPGAGEADVEGFIRQIEEPFRQRLAIHYFPSLAQKLEGVGMHLSNGFRHVPDGFFGTLSISCHSIEEVEREKSTVDYLFLSPIFDSVSKSGYKSAFSDSDIRAASASGVIDSKVAALGGITSANVAQVAAMGFGGAAVLGGLWGDRTMGDIMRRYGEYRGAMGH